MSDTPFTTHGDEPVEARIISWVLGEASAFEAAELERLCQKQPELMLFKRRMLALHGMLNESENVGQDPNWRLPSGKRDVIEELIGKETAATTLQEREKRIRKSQIRAFLAVAACFIVTLFAMSLFLVKPARMNKEVPVIVTYSAALEEDAAAAPQRKVGMSYGADSPELAPTPPSANSPSARNRVNYSMRKKSNMVPLADIAGELPPELIEGTPKPIVLPKLADKKREAESFQSLPGRDRVTLSMPAGSSKPSAPSSSVAQTTAGAQKGNGVPTPDIKTESPSVDFGESADFGSGWGGGGQVSGHDVGYAFRGVPVDQEMGADIRRESSQGLAPAESDPFSNAADDRDELAMKTGDPVKDTVLNRVLGRSDAGMDSFAEELGQLSDERMKLKEDRSDLNGSRTAKQVKIKTKHLEIEQKNSDDLGFDWLMDAQGPVAGAKRDQSQLTDGKMLLFKTQREREKKPAVPAQIGDEISAAEDPFSTFSLNVSDASFQIAQAALARGEHPDPEGIKVEQFYNAVDYGDPAPTAGLPVAGTIEQVAHPVIPGRNLVRVAVKTAAAGRSAAQPLRLTLLVDQSGSMVREDRQEAMNEALAGLSKLLTANDKVTVIGFSRTSHLLADGVSGDRAGALKELIHQEASEGGTNLEEAINLGERLALRHKLKGAQNRIVLFTDGAANLGDADPDRLADKVTALRQQGIAFDIAGIAADELNDELLAELARNGNGRYYVVGKGAKGDLARKLAGAFRPAAENVKVQVRFNPERVARYKLIGFEKDRLKTEDFRNDAVDAAEMAAEEAGVAIYQVETIADGRGEIGEVSVRFRDAESREMVERSWTLPYDAGAPAVDRATPSMQLATLATLLGQKLKGGDLADAIDFNQLNSIQAEVKQAYGSDSRVLDLLQMVDAVE